MGLPQILPTMYSKAKKKILSNMGKDTVVLDLNTYNELRDFKREILEGKTCTFYTAYVGNHDINTKFITKDETIIALSEENEKLGKKDQEHNTELKRLRDEFLKERDKNIQLTKDLGSLLEEKIDVSKTLSKVKRMSIWKFIKWR